MSDCLQLVVQSVKAKVRREIFEGREYLVAPVIPIVEGVLNGALVTAEEIGKYPASWNGIPLPINHPMKNGQYVSANQLDILETNVVGRFFNAQFDGKKLKGELWVDIAKCNELGGEALDALNILEAGGPLEVSTAYFSDDVKVSGVFNGKRYTMKHTNLRPDHLALLPHGIGACSWEDGAGAPRVATRQVPEEEEELTTNIIRKVGDKWVLFDHTGKKILGRHDTKAEAEAQERAIQATKHNEEGGEDGLEHNEKFTPPDAGDAPEAVKKILAAVYSSIRQKWVDAHPDDPENEANKASAAKQAWAAVKNAGWYKEQGVWHKKPKANILQRFKEIVGNMLMELAGEEEEVDANEASHDQIREALRSALKNEAPKDYFYIRDVWDARFVYEQEAAVGTSSGKSTLYERAYSVDDAGNVTLAKEKTQVREVRKYEPVITNEKEEEPVDKKTLIDGLIANEKTHWTEEDRSELEKLEVKVLEKMAPKESIKIPETRPSTNTQTQTQTQTLEPAPTPAPAPVVQEAKPKTTEEYIASLPEGEAKEFFINSLRKQQEYRARLLANLKANKKCQFSEEELKGFKTEMLEKLYLALTPDSYVGVGLPRTNTTGDDEGVPEPPPVVMVKAEDKKEGK